MGSLVLAATGDSLVTQRLSTIDEPEFLRVVELLRHAAAAFTSLETTIRDNAGVEAYRQEMAGNLASVREIRQRVEWLVVSLHARADGARNHQSAPSAATVARQRLENGTIVVSRDGGAVVRFPSGHLAGRHA